MGNDEIASAASFLAGFDELGPLNLCQTGTVFVFKRFGIPETKVGCFIGDALGCMNLWNCGGLLLSYGLSFCGWTGFKSFIAPILSTVIFCMVGVYLWFIKGIVAQSLMGYAFILYIVAFNDYKQEYKKENETKIFIGQYICPVLSSFATFVIFVFDCIIFRICMYDHGNDGVRKYYLFLCISGLAFGFDQSLSAKVIGAKMAYNILGMEAASLLAPVLHWSIKLFSGIFGSHNIDNRILFWHLVIMCAISFAGMFLWMLFIFLHWGDDMYMATADTSRSAKASFKRCLSPFFLGILGMGSVFWLYPAICPFMIVNPLYFHNVQLTLAIFGTLSNLIPWLASDSGDVIKAFGGSVKGYTKIDVWNYGIGIYYHYSWFTVIILLMLIWISTTSIHYPHGFVAKCVFQRWPAVLCSCLSFFLTLFLKAIGIGGCFGNAIGPVFFAAEVSGKFDTDAKIQIAGGLYGHTVSFSDVKFNDLLNLSVDFKGRDIRPGGYIPLIESATFVILYDNSNRKIRIPCPYASVSLKFQTTKKAIIESIDLGDTFFPGGSVTSNFASLLKVEIRNLALETPSSQLKVTKNSDHKSVYSMDITLEFDRPFGGCSSFPKEYTLGGQSLKQTASKIFITCFDGAVYSGTLGTSLSFSNGSNITIDSSGNVSITALTFSSASDQFTISDVDSVTAGTGSLKGSSRFSSVNFITKDAKKYTGYMPCPMLTGSFSVSESKLSFSELDLGIFDCAQVNTASSKLDVANPSSIQNNEKLNKIIIKGLRISSGSLTVNGKSVSFMDITLEFETASISPDGEKMWSYYLYSKTKFNTSGNKVIFYDSNGDNIASNHTVSAVSIRNGNIVIEQTKGITNTPFKDLTFTFSTSPTILGSGTVCGIGSSVVLHGTQNGVEIQSDPLFLTTGASGFLSNSNEKKLEASKLEFGNPVGKAGGFSNASNSSGHKLTKIVFSNRVTNGINIEGFDLNAPATLTLAFQGGGIEYKSGFSLKDPGLSLVPFVGGGIFFPDHPADFAHGSTFGTVCLDLSLFHLTAAAFTTQAYSVGYGVFKCALDSGCLWPTRDFGGFRSFFWWLGYGLKNGYRRFRGLADIDIISVIS